MPISLPIRGRGVSENPPNRFEPIAFEVDGDMLDEVSPDEWPLPGTQVFVDATRTILASNDSPDVGFTHSINPYRGCEHGCVYCYARPFHEYLGLSAGLDFETKIFAKPNAPTLLRRELAAPSWRPTWLAMSGVTDCYQPIERRLRITRGCLEVLAECRHPVGVITKNHLITRDADLLGELARHRAGSATITLTTLDIGLARIMEPRASSPSRRLDAIATLARAGVPTAVSVAPVVPGLTDHEVPTILKAARDAGATSAFFVPLRLPGAVRPLFLAWLDRHLPDRRDKVLNRLREMKNGQLNDARFGSRFRGNGVFYEQIHATFSLYAQRLRYGPMPELNADAFRPPSRGGQMTMF